MNDEVKASTTPVGRPEVYTNDARVCLSASGGSKLHKGGDRRAIVDALVDRGGCMTLGQIDEHFRASVRDKVIALVRIGWLTINESGVLTDSDQPEA